VNVSGNSCDTINRGVVRCIGTTRRSLSGYLPLRNGSYVAYESRLERDFLVKMNSNLAVLDITPQPIKIPFQYPNGRRFEYTPDFLVHFRLGQSHPENYQKPLLIEVKPRNEWKLNWRAWLPKWKAAWRYAQEQGYAFHIMDESRIRDMTLHNIEFLSRYKRMEFDECLSNLIVANVEQHGQISFQNLISFHFSGIGQASGIAHLWHLVATRKIDCDLSLPLSNETCLWVPNYE
jgi:hypothetical protein